MVGKSSSVKRTRSPEPGDTHSAKRTRPLVDGARAAVRDEVRRKEPKEERDRKRAERDEEFRIKYTRAFPNWVFHFEFDMLEPETATLRKELEKMVVHMGAVSLCFAFYLVQSSYPA